MRVEGNQDSFSILCKFPESVQQLIRWNMEGAGSWSYSLKIAGNSAMSQFQFRFDRMFALYRIERVVFILFHAILPMQSIRYTQYYSDHLSQQRRRECPVSQSVTHPPKQIGHLNRIITNLWVAVVAVYN